MLCAGRLQFRKIAAPLADNTMERYLLFAWGGEPRGGWTDSVGSFVSLDAALTWKDTFHKNDSYQIVDTNGEPNLFIVGLADDGITTRQRNITAREIQNNWVASKEAAKWTKDDVRFGPKLTNVPDGPSIYASPAEWEAYRKAQQPN